MRGKVLTKPNGTFGQEKSVRAAGFLDAIARRYRGALNAFFSRRMGGRQDCEDLTQEVFLRLARRGDLETIERVDGYLFQTAAAVLIDHGRRERSRHRDRIDPYDDDTHQLVDFSPERVLIAKEQVERTLAAIEALPERARHAVLLFRFEGMKQAEIARLMGISVSAVEKHIKLGMVRLNEAMKDEN